MGKGKDVHERQNDDATRGQQNKRLSTVNVLENVFLRAIQPATHGPDTSSASWLLAGSFDPIHFLIMVFSSTVVHSLRA